ncbi:MAG: CRISPR-associated endonuclease Cas1 [Thermoactinomyces sp.]
MEKQSLYLTRPVSLSKSQGTIALKIDDENAKKLIPVEQIESIYVLTPMTFSSKLLELISRHEIQIHFFHYYGFYIGSFIPNQDKTGQSKIVIEQALTYRNEKRRLMLAKEFLLGAQTNLMRNLARLTRKSGFSLSPENKQSLEVLRSKVRSTSTYGALLGLEGKFRSIYYQSLDEYLKKEHPSYQIVKRTRRPPKNRMNTLISFEFPLICNHH